MTPKEYFKENYDKIYLTAKFVASRRNPPESADEVMKEIEKGYECNNLINHSKTIVLNDSSLNISSCVDEIKDLERENIVFYAMINGKAVKFFYKEGDQFSCGYTDLELCVALFRLISGYKEEKEFPIYICHNHPFACNVVPSTEDMINCLNIKKILSQFSEGAKPILFTIADFAITTKFDYLSFKQFNLL